MSRRWHRTGPRHLALVALSVAALALPGCQSGRASRPTASPTPSSTAEMAIAKARAEMDRSRETWAEVTVEGFGAAPFKWTGEEVVTIAQLGTATTEVTLLSVGFFAPVRIGDGTERFRWAFDLLNTYRDKPGRFQITGAKDKSGTGNMAFLIHMRVKDHAKQLESIERQEDVVFIKRFDEIREPCVVDVGPGADAGTIDCPALAGPNGEVAGYRASWKVLGYLEELPPAVRQPTE